MNTDAASMQKIKNPPIRPFLKPTGIVKTGTQSIVAGLYIGKAPTTSFAGINLGASNLAHPLTNCRLYYSQVTVDPQKSIDYVQRNRNKKVIYRSFVTNSYTNSSSSSSSSSRVAASSRKAAI